MTHMHANITLNHVISKGGGAIEKLLTKYPSETVMTKVLLLVAAAHRCCAYRSNARCQNDVICGRTNVLCVNNVLIAESEFSVKSENTKGFFFAKHNACSYTMRDTDNNYSYLDVATACLYRKH